MVINKGMDDINKVMKDTKGLKTAVESIREVILIKRSLIKLADKIIEIDHIYETTRKLCEEYLVCIENLERNVDFKINVESSDMTFERKKSEAEDIKEGIPIRYFSDEYLETLAVYRKVAEQMIDYDTILFHGSVIAVDGVGYLFTAKSGTGKSTHTRLWREYFGERAVMVNDDKPLLKMTEEGVIAYGTPWDGKHRLSNNISVPLKAICLLSRDQTSHIEKVSGKAVYPLLVQQTYRSSDPVKLEKTLRLLDQMIQKTNVYSLGCNMEPEAASIAFDGMQ